MADVGDAEPLLDHANPAPAPHVTEADKNVGLTTEQAIKGQKALNEHGVFSEYKPVKLRVKGAKDHPTPLVEPTAMAAVDPVDPTYSPKLPKDRMAAGFPSLAQLEQIVGAMPNCEYREYLANEVVAEAKRLLK